MARRPPYRGKLVDPDKLRLQLAGFRLQQEQEAERLAAQKREQIRAVLIAADAEHERKLRTDLGYRMKWIRGGRK
jgi:hypothetical protein